MDTGKENEQIAIQWFKAFNTQDLEELLALYDEQAKHFSPKLKAKIPDSNGLIEGKKALREWWADSFKRLPGLHYEVQTITANEHRVCMEYTRELPGDEDLQVAEVLEIKNGKIIFSRVYHG
ncbi:MAG: nuclear transport factor 2 family protein [Bacteroidetes bacterium]|nr:nuclear transport factor 2 family protein [Bacteroidota bacterium]